MAIERLVEPTAASNDVEDEKIEISLRPTSFKEYIGQEHLKNNIKLAIEAVKKRDDGGAWTMYYCMGRRDWVRRRWRG